MDPHAQNPHVSTTSTSAVATPTPVVPSTGPVDLLAPTEIDTSPALLKRISWGAIFAGATVAVVLTIWFNLLGLAIGLAAFNPSEQQATGFGIGTVIWVLATSIICLFAGGWIAGRLTGSPRKVDRALHGVVAWSVATLFGLWIFSSGVTRAIAGTANFATDVAGAVAPAAGNMMGNVAQQVQLPPEIEQDLQTLQADPQLRRQVMSVIGADSTPQQRAELVDLLASNTGMSHEEAQSHVIRWEQQANLLQYKASNVAETAATSLSAVAFLGVLSMFFGLGSSALGGYVAYPNKPRRLDRERGSTSVITPTARS